jgi:hypothetical protein
MTSTQYKNLNFDQQRRRRSPGRFFYIGLAITAFTLLWRFVPQPNLFWILLVLFGFMAWLASYGWRQALFAFHDFIHRLEQF